VSIASGQATSAESQAAGQAASPVARP
jgi:hypothetical protein